MIQARVLFEDCRIDEEWDNIEKIQRMFETAVKHLQEVLKREKIKQKIKEQQECELTDRARLEEPDNTREGEEAWREMSYLWGMIFCDWGMRQLYAESASLEASQHMAASFSTPASKSDTDLPHSIQMRVEEAEKWLVRSIKGSLGVQHSSAPTPSSPSFSSVYYKRIEKVREPGLDSVYY